MSKYVKVLLFQTVYRLARVGLKSGISRVTISKLLRRVPYASFYRPQPKIHLNTVR